MVLIEKGLQNKVELLAANPMQSDPALAAANPLHKVPVLVNDNGKAVFDSPVICAYLDSLSSQTPLIPGGENQWPILTSAALADGILDAAFSMVTESRRAKEQQSGVWQQRWNGAIKRSCDAIESSIDDFNGDISIAQIGLGAALGYLDFRLPELGWRDGRNALTTWFEAFSQRPSMQATMPPENG